MMGDPANDRHYHCSSGVGKGHIHVCNTIPEVFSLTACLNFQGRISQMFCLVLAHGAVAQQKGPPPNKLELAGETEGGGAAASDLRLALLLGPLRS